MKDLSGYGIKKSNGRQYEYITYVLALVYNLINARVEAYFAPYGLSVSKFNILMAAAYQNDGKGLSQVELGRRLIASASNVTKLVENLVKQKLLTRIQNPQNRRENIIQITAAGRKLINKTWPGYDVLVKTLTEKIPASKRRAAQAVLNDWFVALQQEEKSCSLL